MQFAFVLLPHRIQNYSHCATFREMILSMYILIFAAFASTALAGDFCENGQVNILKCPDGSIVTGIQTTSQLLSADATPVCSALADEILSYDTSPNFFRKDDDPDSSALKVSCADSDYAIESISICTVDGEITATVSNCSHLKYVESNNATYTVVGEPNSPVLKCEDGSVLHSIKYDRDDGGNLIAVATCTAMDVGQGRVSVVDKRDKCTGGQLVEVACPDGYIISGFETTGKMFTPDFLPVCTKINDKVDPTRRATSHTYYFKPEPERLEGDCNFGYPVFTKFSMCFVDGVLAETHVECRHFQGNLKVVDLEDVEERSDNLVLQCAEGAFVQGFSMLGHPGEKRYLIYCAVIVR